MRILNMGFAIIFLVLWFGIIDITASGISNKQTFLTYEVVQGDNLWSIAKKFTDEDYASTVEHIIDQNNLTTTILQPGMVLKIPRN